MTEADAYEPARDILSRTAFIGIAAYLGLYAFAWYVCDAESPWLQELASGIAMLGVYLAGLAFVFAIVVVIISVGEARNHGLSGKRWATRIAAVISLIVTSVLTFLPWIHHLYCNL